MPPDASTNLPMWRSVAPVKAPFSWPNRSDSTRLSGIAPQLTATNGLARRSPQPWIARAISSLPTPDWPSISTGIAEPAAFSAWRSTACMRGLRVIMSLKVSVPERLRLRRWISLSSALAASALRKRHLQALDADRLDHEIGRARAHRRDHVVDAAMRGLHDHRESRCRPRACARARRGRRGRASPGRARRSRCGPSSPVSAAQRGLARRRP